MLESNLESAAVGCNHDSLGKLSIPLYLISLFTLLSVHGLSGNSHAAMVRAPRRADKKRADLSRQTHTNRPCKFNPKQQRAMIAIAAAPKMNIEQTSSIRTLHRWYETPVGERWGGGACQNRIRSFSRRDKSGLMAWSLAGVLLM